MGDGDNGVTGFPLESRTAAGIGNANDALDVRRLGKGASDAPGEGSVFAQEQDFLFLHHAGMSLPPCNDAALPCNMDRYYKHEPPPRP
jgi:hypothetical protein